MNVNLVELNEALAKVIFGGAFNSLLKKLNDLNYVYHVIDFDLPNTRYHPLNNDEISLSAFKHKSSFDYAANEIEDYSWYFLLRFKGLEKGVTFFASEFLYSKTTRGWADKEGVKFPDFFASELQKWIDEEAIKSPYMINSWKEQILARLNGSEDHGE